MIYARMTTTTTTTLRPAPRQTESRLDTSSPDELASSADELISTATGPVADASGASDTILTVFDAMDTACNNSDFSGTVLSIVDTDDEGGHDHMNEIDKTSPNRNHCASFDRQP